MAVIRPRSVVVFKQKVNFGARPTVRHLPCDISWLLAIGRSDDGYLSALIKQLI